MNWKRMRYFYARILSILVSLFLTLNDPRVMTLVRVKKGQKVAKVDPP